MIVARVRNQGGNVKYFIQWKNYFSTENMWESRVGAIRTLVRRPHRSLLKKTSWSCRHRRMQRKICSSIWEGSESDPSLQREHCHAACVMWCERFSWFAVRGGRQTFALLRMKMNWMPVFKWRHLNSNYKTIDPPNILLKWCIRAAEN